MAVKGAIRIMKWMLILFNIPLLCAGAIAIGLGGWGLGSEYGAEKMKDLTGSELYRGAAIAIIVGGSILVVISFLGAAGAYLEKRWMLGIYFLIVLLLLILFVTAAAVGFAFRSELEKGLTKRMENSLLTQYLVNIENNDDNYAVTTVWDSIQKKLDCCGVTGGLTSMKSWFIWQSSMWYMQQNASNKQLVPSSCCVSEEITTTCQYAGNATMPPQMYANSSITERNPDLHEMGCLDQLKDYIYNRAVAVAGISVAVLIVMFTCLLLAACVCSNIKSKKGVML